MASSCRRLIAASLAVAFVLMPAAGALAGGSGDDHDDANTLRYYGFVKDAAGRPMANARVNADVKGLGMLSALTDGTGAYRIPVPRIGNNTLSPQSITISCARDGYKQVRTVVRSNLNQKPLLAVEVECVLQGAAGK